MVDYSDIGGIEDGCAEAGTATQCVVAAGIAAVVGGVIGRDLDAVVAEIESAAPVLAATVVAAEPEVGLGRVAQVVGCDLCCCRMERGSTDPFYG